MDAARGSGRVHGKFGPWMNKCTSEEVLHSVRHAFVFLFHSYLICADLCVFFLVCVRNQYGKIKKYFRSLRNRVTAARL